MSSIPRLIKWIFLLAVLFLGLMTLARWGYYTSFRLAGSNNPLPAFWLGFRYDARIVAVVMLILLIIGSFARLNPFRSRHSRQSWLFFLGFFSLLLIFFYTIDFLHYRYLSKRLNASALSFLEDAKISGSMVWQTYPVVKILLGIVILTILVTWIIKRLYKSVAATNSNPGKSARAGWFIATFLLCALAIFGRLGQYPLRWSDAFSIGNDFNANLALNPLQSFFSSLSFRKTGYDLEKVKQYYPLIASYLGVDKPNAATLNFERRVMKRDSGISTQPNIVLVICESFSAYKSSMWGNPLNTTPYFSELCGQGIFFDNCFTPTIGTARGVWATITGIPDVEPVKTASRNPAMVDQRTIINSFEGYNKYYFLGGSTSWANIRGVLMNNIAGLRIYEQDDFEAPQIDVWGVSDKNLFLEANKILAKQDKPFFAIIQTADNHRPYTIPKEDQHEFVKLNFSQDSIKKFGFESNDELNAFRYTDFCYKKFMEAAKQAKYFDNTIFVFIGDHGIAGDAGAMFPPAWTINGLTSNHVPLLFYAPRLLPAQKIHAVASQIDVLPTIAGIANINYVNTTLGIDLLDRQRKGIDRNNAAFIIDPNSRNIGIIQQDFYFSHLPKTTREQLVWANFAKPKSSTGGDSLKNNHRNYTHAFYETARYMLLNNKKFP